MAKKSSELSTPAEEVDWTVPTREEEAANIEDAAEQFRDNTDYDNPDPPDPWPNAFRLLTHLQKEFDSIPWPPFDWRDPSTSGPPREARPLARKAYKILRNLGIDRRGTHYILGECFSRYAQYRITVTERGDKATHEVIRSTRSKIRTSIKRERVGTAIMLLRADGMGIVKAQRHIAGGKMIDFFPDYLDPTETAACFGDFEDTKKHWAAWKRDAFRRGYADSRAYSAEIEEKPWPNDQFWLDNV